MQVIVTVLTAVLNSILGLLVYKKNPHSATNRLFTLLTLIISFWAVFNYFSLTAATESQVLFWIRAVMFVTAPLGPTIFLLATAFPKKHIPLSKKYVVAIVALVITTAILSQTPFMFKSVSLEGGTITPTPGPAIALFAMGFLGGIALAFINLIRSYLKAKGREKIQIRYLFVGIIATFLLVAITNFIFVLYLKNSSFVVLGPAFSLILVGSIAYSIVKHRFLDISTLLVRALALAVITLAFAGLFAASLFAIPNLLDPEYRSLASILVAIFLSYAFNPLRILIEKATNRFLYSGDYSFEATLEELSNIVRSNLSVTGISDKVAHVLHQQLHPSYVSYAFVTKDDKPVIKTFFTTKALVLDADLIKKIAQKAKKSLLITEDLASGVIREQLELMQVALVVPLRVGANIHGVVFLGMKSNGEPFSSKDLRLLEIFGPQLSVAIQNAMAYREIKDFADTLDARVKEATRELRSANRNLRHLDKLKDEFVYLATHELKTPVTVMKGYLSMIQDESYGKIPKQLHEPLEQISLANQQLITLVNDLLEIARSEAKSIKVGTSPVVLCDVVEQTIHSLNTLAKQKHITINYSCPHKQLAVMADTKRLQEIMNNLLSNAIKYSDAGTIQVSHVVEAGQVITHIKDQGHGISEEDHDKVFTRFFRAEVLANKVPGTGLGLFIVKQLVEKMGGKIWFSSKLGQGTTFSFSLKLAPEKE